MSEQRGEESKAQLLGVSYGFNQRVQGRGGVWKGDISLLPLFTIIGISSAKQLIFGGYKSQDLPMLLINTPRSTSEQSCPRCCPSRHA